MVLALFVFLWRLFFRMFYYHLRALITVAFAGVCAAQSAMHFQVAAGNTSGTLAVLYMWHVVPHTL